MFFIKVKKKHVFYLQINVLNIYEIHVCSTVLNAHYKRR